MRYSETAAQWDKNDPYLGMCAIMALAVNDLYGGEIGKIHVDSTSHYFNIIDERIVDLTASQFKQSINYSDYELVDRNIIVSDTSTKVLTIKIIEVKPYPWVEVIDEGKRKIEQEFIKTPSLGH